MKNKVSPAVNVGTLLVSMVIMLSCNSCSGFPGAKFKLPQETTSLPFDKDSAEYDGVVYQKIRLGMSFAEINRLMQGSHHTFSPTRRKADVQWVYDAADDWPLADVTSWRPYFSFIEDKGVYRLYQIGGQLPDSKTYTAVRIALNDKYAKVINNATSNENQPDGPSSMWVVGQFQYSLINLSRADRVLLITDAGLEGLARKQRDQQAPAL